VNLTPELAALYNQQLSQYDELKDLKEKVRLAEQRYLKISWEIAEALSEQILPSVAARSSGADSAPAPLGSREVAGGFRLDAYTPRGASMLDALERVLGKVPS
jgi:hypothetical protein